MSDDLVRARRWCPLAAMPTYTPGTPRFMSSNFAVRAYAYLEQEKVLRPIFDRASAIDEKAKVEDCIRTLRQISLDSNWVWDMNNVLRVPCRSF